MNKLAMIAATLLSTSLPMYQVLLLGLFMPPIGAAVLRLRIKIRGSFTKSQSIEQIVRNTSDWVAFAALTATGYLVMFGITIYAHYWQR